MAAFSKGHKTGKYKSRLEAYTAAQLRKLKIKFKYEPHKLHYLKRVRMGQCGECLSAKVYSSRTYLPDFLLDNGTYIEAKGYFTATERAKIEAVLRSNPKIKLKMLFGADNRIKGEYRYSNWCKDRGIDYAIKRVKPEWGAREQGASNL